MFLALSKIRVQSYNFFPIIILSATYFLFLHAETGWLEVNARLFSMFAASLAALVLLQPLPAVAAESSLFQQDTLVIRKGKIDIERGILAPGADTVIIRIDSAALFETPVVDAPDLSELSFDELLSGDPVNKILCLGNEEPKGKAYRQHTRINHVGGIIPTETATGRTGIYIPAA